MRKGSLARLSVLAAIALVGLCVLRPLRAYHDAGAPRTSADPHAAPAMHEQRDFTLLFTGDIMLSRAVGERMAREHDWALPFHQIAGALRDADLRYCNLECPVSDRGRDLHHLYSFRADPRVLEGLKLAGFNVASQANNHAYDWGPEALLDSLERLHDAGVLTVGAGHNALAAHYPLLLKVHSLRVAFLAYVNIEPRDATASVDRAGVAWLDPAQVLADIRFARPLADLVIVCPHWGVEYALKPTSDQVQLAHQMIDAGADLIVGSHPHVVQPVEEYHDRWIAYSLGNFIFDQQPPNTHRGLMLQATVHGGRIVKVTAIPININSHYEAALEPTPKRLLASAAQSSKR